MPSVFTRLFSMRLSTQIATLLLTSIIGVVAVSYACLCYSKCSNHYAKPGDEYYQAVVNDVSAPWIYTAEAFLSSQLMFCVDESLRAQSTIGFQTQKREFESAMEKCTELLPKGEIRELVLGPVKSSGARLIQTIEAELIPAIKAKDREAATQANAKAAKQFVEHKSAIATLKQKLASAKVGLANRQVNVFSGNKYVIFTLCAVTFAILGVGFALLSKSRTTERAIANTQTLIDGINSSIVSFIINSEGKVTSANEYFAKLIGASRDEVVGKDIYTLPGSNSNLRSELPTLFASARQGNSPSIRIPFHGINDKSVWIDGSISALPSIDAKQVNYLFCGFDATARQAIDEEMTELRVRVDVMNMTSIVSEANLRGDIISCNDKYCEVSQYTREEAIGQGHNLTRHEDMSKDVFKEMWATIGKGKMFRGVIKNRAKDGSPYYVDAVIAPIMGVNGKPKKYLGVRYDITASEIERQNAKGILAAVDSAYAYIEFDLTGNVIAANSNFLDALGYRKDEIVGKHHRIFCDSSFSNSNEYKQFWTSLGDGQPQQGVFKRISKSGATVWIQAVFAPVRDEAGRVSKVVKIATDITSMENANIELRNKVDSILNVVSAAAAGDLTQQIEVKGEDPIGKLGESLSSFFHNLTNNISTIGENATALAGASEELSAVSAQMSSNATETAAQAQLVSAATEEVNVNVATVTTGVDELNSAIREIAKNASDAARVSQQAVTIASDTNRTISKLGDSSNEIGKVVKVITSIAEQTNLLALNATIEAARAGEAGKGFAVVANEVKELAKETARATEDISHKIETIQSDTNGAISAIQEICEVINRINDISNTIASAVEEQTATANEMGRNVSEAARGSAEIAQNITAVADATQSTTEGASNSMQAASELSRMAGDLQRLVGQFKYHRDSLNSRRSGLTPAVQMTSFGVPQTV